MEVHQDSFFLKFSDTGDILVRILQKMRRHIMRCRDFHGSEFAKAEICNFTVLFPTYALLPEKHGSGIIYNYQKTYNQKRQQQNQYSEKRQDNVQEAFKKVRIHTNLDINGR